MSNQSKYSNQRVNTAVINLGGNYEASQTSLNSFKEQIMQCKQLIKSPEGFIKVYFSKLKTQIETDREVANFNFKKTIKTLQKGLNTHYMLMENELDKIQEDCLQSLSSNKKKHWKNFERRLKEYEDKLMVLENDMASLSESDSKQWEDINLASKQLKLKLGSIKKDLEEELLMNRAFSYKSNKLGIEVLEPVRVKTPEQKFTGTFHFTKTGFKEFSQTKGAQFSSPLYSFNNIVWYAELENEDGENMGAYVYCIRQRASQEVTAHLGFKLHNKQNPSNNEFARVEYKFTEDSAHGFPHFISFRKIFYGGFYDSKSDSIGMTIFIEVKYIREYLKSGKLTPLPKTGSAKAPELKSALKRKINTVLDDYHDPSLKPSVMLALRKSEKLQITSSEIENVQRTPTQLVRKPSVTFKSSEKREDILADINLDTSDKSWPQLNQLWSQMLSSWLSSINLRDTQKFS